MEGVFALHNFVGQPVSYWRAKKIDVPKPKIEKNLGHHIVIIDRSGSMYYDITDTKAMVEKVFTVEEFHDASLLLTLISYSSHGDATVHFSRTPVSEVLDAKNPYIGQIRSIRASCLTCASQALEIAEPFIQNETTAISLHSDGWFNDASPSAEKKAIDKILTRLGKLPNVMINTIAYSTSSDFTTLSSIANKMSGTCILAKNIKQVYEALHSTTALLAGRVTPAIPLSIEGADWQLAINFSKRKVNGSATDIIIRGMEEEDDLHVYRFSRLSKESFAKAGLPAVDKLGLPGAKVLAAFAKTKLAEGKVNEAKFALVTLRNEDLLKKHYRALSSAQLTALSLDLDELMAAEAMVDQSVTYGFDANRPTLKQLFDYLDENRGKFTLHMPEFLRTYQKRGLKRLEGKWEDGKFTPAPVRLVEDVDYSVDPAAEVTGFDINKAEATVNMETRRDASLMKEGQYVNRIGGKKLSLSLVRSYTIVADGQPNVDVLPIMISEKEVYEKLVEMGFITHNSALTTGANVGISGYDHRNIYAISLNDFPTIPMVATELTLPSKAEMNGYCANLMKRKIVEALIPKDENSDVSWTPEQIAELRSVCLTPNLAFVPPSANPFADRDEAIANGWIDSYTRYAVSFGTNLATDLRGSLWSANEYLARRFEVTVAGEKQKKPKFTQLLEADTTVENKTNAKLVPSPIDTFVHGLFTESLFDQKVQKLSVAELRSLLKEYGRTIAATEAKLSELALAIGSTGLIPDEWNAKIWTAEQLQAAYPGIDVPKSHADSTFYEVDGVLLGVHEEVAWYSTPQGIEEAKRITSAS